MTSRGNLHKKPPLFNEAPEAPVTYMETSLLLDTKQMEIGQYYRIMYRSKESFVVKWPNGSVEFYRPPKTLPFNK